MHDAADPKSVRPLGTHSVRAHVCVQTGLLIAYALATRHPPLPPTLSLSHLLDSKRGRSDLSCFNELFYDLVRLFWFSLLSVSQSVCQSFLKSFILCCFFSNSLFAQLTSPSPKIHEQIESEVETTNNGVKVVALLMY